MAAVNGSVDGVKYFPNTVNFDEREMQVRVFYNCILLDVQLLYSKLQILCIILLLFTDPSLPAVTAASCNVYEMVLQHLTIPYSC